MREMGTTNSTIEIVDVSDMSSFLKKHTIVEKDLIVVRYTRTVRPAIG
jgi:hypothetical protein